STLAIRAVNQGASMPDGFSVLHHLDANGIHFKSITPKNDMLLSQEILSIVFNTDGYTVEGGGKSVTYTRVTESEQASSASGSKD
ncbi:hypothetical protein MJN51_31250, partial [Salmonella enterica subsp. enterica serovar Kentucky]|nr:hypothetical protein [Salmonella enterica subsp. enterica serovar Kentucky]